jgi:hypothetical protein
LNSSRVEFAFQVDQVTTLLLPELPAYGAGIQIDLSTISLLYALLVNLLAARCLAESYIIFYRIKLFVADGNLLLNSLTNLCRRFLMNVDLASRTSWGTVNCRSLLLIFEWTKLRPTLWKISLTLDPQFDIAYLIIVPDFLTVPRSLTTAMLDFSMGER